MPPDSSATTPPRADTSSVAAAVAARRGAATSSQNNDQNGSQNKTPGSAVQPSGFGDLASYFGQIQSELQRAATSFLPADRLVRLALTEIRKTPGLLSCTKESFAGALMVCAQLGLEPGPTGEIFLSPRKNRGKGVVEVSVTIGYKGMAALYWRHPLAKYLDAQTVYENDEFDYELGTAAFLRHRPARSDRGQPLGLWYAVAQLTNGGFRFMVMNRDEVEIHRRRSDSPNSPAWTNDYDAMAQKTCVRSMFGLMPKSTEMALAAAVDEQVQEGLDAGLGRPLIDMPTTVDGHRVVDGDVTGHPDAGGPQ